MVVYYYQMECHEEKLVCYLQDQGHIEGLYNVTVSTISSKRLTRLQPDMI